MTKSSDDKRMLAPVKEKPGKHFIPANNKIFNFKFLIEYRIPRTLRDKERRNAPRSRNKLRTQKVSSIIAAREYPVYY